MRLYAPADTPSVLADLLAEPSLARGVVHHAVLPARDAVFGTLTCEMHSLSAVRVKTSINFSPGLPAILSGV